MKEFLVRPAEAKDDAVVAQLLLDAYIQTYAKKMPHVVVTEDRKVDLNRTAQRRSEAAVTVLERYGEIIGTVAAYPPGSPHSKSWRSDAAEIRYMAVHREFHGRSLSKILLDEVVRLTHRWGVSKITLHARRGAVGIAKMYERHGFVRAPEGDLDLLPEIFLEAYILNL